MRLSLTKRSRIITLYLNKKLHFHQKRFKVLKNLAADEDILTSENTIRKIVKRWLKNGINNNFFTRFNGSFYRILNKDRSQIKDHSLGV